jgi:hypothetical protein
MMVAPLLAMGIDTILAARIVGVIAHGLAAYILALGVWTIAEQANTSSKNVRWAVIIVWLATLLDPLALALSLSGMEVSLARLWLAAIFWSLATRRTTTTGIFAALAVLTRPELGIVLVMILPSFVHSLRDLFRSLLPVCAALLLFVSFYFFATGRPLPASFYVKVHNKFHWTSVERLFYDVGLLYNAALVLLLFGLGYALWRGIERRIVLGLCGFFVALLLALAYMGMAGTGNPPHLPGSSQNLYYVRYWATGFIALLPLAGLWFCGSNPPINQKERFRLLGVLNGLIIILFAFGMLANWNIWPQLLCQNSANIRDMQVRAALLLRDKTAPNASIAVSDAGAIRYFSERKVIDLVGLNLSREHIKLPPKERLSKIMPDYAVLFPHWHGGVSYISSLGYKPIAEIRLKNNTICASNVMIIWKRKTP